MISLAALSALLQVLLVDLTLAGDNALVLGMIAASLDPAERRKAMTLGIAGAAVLRILLAVVATQLLAIVGLTLAGGILLLWVAWKMFRELTQQRAEPADAASGAPAPRKGALRRALVRIVIADVSMSLDNVLAVAGTARDHVWVLITGLMLSVLLMGTASLVVAKLMARAPWLAWLGIAVVAYAAVAMIVEGWGEVGRRFA